MMSIFKISWKVHPLHIFKLLHCGCQFIKCVRGCTMLPNSFGGTTSKIVCSSPVDGTRELGLKCRTHLTLAASLQTQLLLGIWPINQEISTSITDYFILGISLSKAETILKCPCGTTVRGCQSPRHCLSIETVGSLRGTRPSLSSPHGPAGLHHNSLCSCYKGPA